MLDINLIHNEIKKLEECECTNWNVCEKLATLYIIRDHYKNNKIEKSVSSPEENRPVAKI